MSSDDSAIGDHGALENYDNSMLNDIALLSVVRLLNLVLVDDLNIAANGCIVINDRPLDDAVLTCKGPMAFSKVMIASGKD